MSQLPFDTFFKSATGHEGPFDYQHRLACGGRGHRGEADWLTGGTNADSRLINIPTGLGRTAAK